MPCPTCDHEMHHLGKSDRGDPVLWCPRCGTIRDDGMDGRDDFRISRPMLADRAKALVEMCIHRPHLYDTAEWLKRMHHLGILESVYSPTERPTP